MRGDTEGLAADPAACPGAFVLHPKSNGGRGPPHQQGSKRIRFVF